MDMILAATILDMSEYVSIKELLLQAADSSPYAKGRIGVVIGQHNK
jgi:hypothetical protein